MFRTPCWAMALLFVVIGVLAVVCTAQTPPPASGDWVIEDETRLTGADITIDGSVKVLAGGKLVLEDSQLECINISISGGRMELLDTDLTLSGSAQSVVKASNGTFVVLGGTITSTGLGATLELPTGCGLNGTTIIGMKTVWVTGWNTTVLDCTLLNFTASGVTLDPVVTPTGSIEIVGNTIIGPVGSGIYVNLSVKSGSTVLVRLANNQIERPGGTGINLITNDTYGVHIDLSGNRINGSVYHGVFASFEGTNLVADLSSILAENNQMDGVRIVLNALTGASLDLYNIASLNNGLYGLSVFSLYRMTTGIRIVGLNASLNAKGGLQLSACPNAELHDSNVMNVGATYGDFVMTQSTLTIRRTTTRTAYVLLADPFSSVTSLKSLDLTVRWRDGSPVANRGVSLMDEKGLSILSQVTDGSGRLGVNTVWDWRVTAQATEVRRTFRVVLIGEGWRLQSEPMPLDADIQAIVVLEDTIPPVLLVERPVEGMFTSTAEIRVEGTCEDLQTALALVQVSIDDEPDWDAKVWHDTLGLESWRHTFSDLPDGTYNVYVRAYDVQNHPGGLFAQIVVRDVTVDTVPPYISVQTPEEGALTNVPGLLVRGSVEDGASVTVNGTDALVEEGAFEGWVLLQEGRNQLVVVATDAAGNTNTVRRDVVLDTVPPFLSVEGVVDGRLWVPVDGRQVNGTTEPGGLVELTVDGHVTRLPVGVDGTFGFWLEPLDDGTAVVLEASDSAGNLARHVIIVDLGDDVPPEITIHGPTGGTIINTSNVLVSGSSADPQGVALVQVSIDDMPDWDLKEWRDAQGTEDWSFSFEGLPDGTFDIYVRAFDSLSRTSYSRAMATGITVDTTTPWLDVFGPPDGALTNGTRIRVWGSVEAGARVTIAGAEVPRAGGTFDASVNLAEGLNVISVRAIDAAGNVATVSRTVMVDTVPPSLSVHGLEDGRLTLRGEDREVQGVTEPGSALTVLVRGSLLHVPVLDDGSFTVALPKLGDVLVESRDAAGNLARLEFVAEAMVEEPSTPERPTGAVVGAAVLGTMAVIGALLAVESFRFSALLVLMPLYARLKKDKVLDNKARYLLHGIIIDNPGIHYRALLREFGLSNGIATYHLDVLEREGFVRSVRDGRFRRFYSVDVKVPKDRRLPPGQLSDRIRRLVEASPGISQKRIIEELGISRRAAGYHLDELVSKGELQASRKGRNTVYRIRPRKVGARSVSKEHGMGVRNLPPDAKAKMTDK